MTESKSVALPLGDIPVCRFSALNYCIISLTKHQELSVCRILQKRKSTVPIGTVLLMGWIVGFEPTASRATIWRANQLRHTHHMARLKGLEPLTHCLEGSCSIQLSYKRIKYRHKTDGAGDGNRTHATSLEGWDSTIELHPHKSYS